MFDKHTKNFDVERMSLSISMGMSHNNMAFINILVQSPSLTSIKDYECQLTPCVPSTKEVVAVIVARNVTNLDILVEERHVLEYGSLLQKSRRNGRYYILYPFMNDNVSGKLVKIKAKS